MSIRHVTRPDQGLSSLAPGGGKMRDPGNEVGRFASGLDTNPNEAITKETDNE